MKAFTLLFLSFFTLSLFAATVDIVSSEYGVEDDEHNKSLCLTVVRLPQNGKLIGVVETIQDCFYARRARHSSTNQLQIDLNKLKLIDHRPLRQHLQRQDTQLKFYFSDGE